MPKTFTRKTFTTENSLAVALLISMAYITLDTVFVKRLRKNCFRQLMWIKSGKKIVLHRRISVWGKNPQKKQITQCFMGPLHIASYFRNRVLLHSGSLDSIPSIRKPGLRWLIIPQGFGKGWSLIRFTHLVLLQWLKFSAVAGCDPLGVSIAQREQTGISPVLLDPYFAL